MARQESPLFQKHGKYEKTDFAYFLAAVLAFVLTGRFMKGGLRTGSLGGEVTDSSGAVDKATLDEWVPKLQASERFR